MSDWLFIARFLNSHRSGVLKRWYGWCRVKLQPSWCKFCVHRTTMLHVTSCKATYVRCMHVLAVTCHRHIWQNDQDLLRATVVTWGWKGYRNKSQHRKLTLEKKILLLRFEPTTFQLRVCRSELFPPQVTSHRHRSTLRASLSGSYATERALFISALRKRPPKGLGTDKTVEAT